MHLSNICDQLPPSAYSLLSQRVDELRPAQEKAIAAGLLEGKNLLVCTPTASGKTFVAELAFIKNILEQRKKAIYIVPLRALGNEKYKDFHKRYSSLFSVAVSTGDFDSGDPYLATKDLIIVTAEKMDSLIRHHAPWIAQVGTIIVDEAHLLNDASRGPTLEILMTLLRRMLPSAQLIALSATIGNPQELVAWLNAELVEDDWRPVVLKKGIIVGNVLTFYKE